jgi:hypothetical protein
VTSLKKDQAGDFRLAFRPPKRRMFTIRGGDGKPLAGVRLSPLTLESRQEQYLAVTLPDALADRLAATTGPDGRAEIDCLEPSTPLYALRARVPGLGTHAVGLAPSQFKSNAVDYCSGIGLMLGWRIVLIRRRTKSCRPRFQAASLT